MSSFAGWVVRAAFAGVLVLSMTGCGPAATSAQPPGSNDTASASPTVTPSAPNPLPTVTVTVTATPDPTLEPPREPPAIEGLPDFMRGRWCAEVADECFDSAEMSRSYPETYVTRAASDQYVSGAIRVGLCIHRGGDGECADAASEMDYLFLPAGIARDCARSAEAFALAACDPDYTDVHDNSRPRLLHLFKSQQGASYEDVPPMYRTGGE